MNEWRDAKAAYALAYGAIFRGPRTGSGVVRDEQQDAVSIHLRMCVYQLRHTVVACVGC